MRFTGTTVFAALLMPLDVDDTKLTALIDQLAGTIEHKKAANALATKKKDIQKYRSDEIKLEAAKKKLIAIREEKRQLFSGESLTHYEICHITAEMRGTCWSERAKAALLLPRKAHEGPGEQSVRIDRGLPLVCTQDKRDMDDGDVKWLDSGKESLQAPKVGKCGVEAAWGFLLGLTDVEKKKIPREVWDYLKTGELPKDLLDGKYETKVPDWMLARLMDYILPSLVIGQYGDIYAAFNFGYLVVPEADADEAWLPIGISQGKPRYRLRREYSLRKMLEEST